MNPYGSCRTSASGGGSPGLHNCLHPSNIKQAARLLADGPAFRQLCVGCSAYVDVGLTNSPRVAEIMPEIVRHKGYVPQCTLRLAEEIGGKEATGGCGGVSGEHRLRDSNQEENGWDLGAGVYPT